MPEQNVVAIRASAGGISALRRLLAMIPHDLNAAVFLAYIVRRSRGARAQIRSASFLEHGPTEFPRRGPIRFGCSRRADWIVHSRSLVAW